MIDDFKVRCPYCEGHGVIQRSELVEKLSTPALRQRLDARVAGITTGCGNDHEPSGCAQLRKRSAFLESTIALEAEPKGVNTQNGFG